VPRASRHLQSMKPALALLRADAPLSDDVAELALRLAMENGDHNDVAAWLVRQNDPSANVVRVVLSGYVGAEMCLRDHRLLPLVSKLTTAEQEEVLHGLVDAFRAGRVRHWYGHSGLVRLACNSMDPEIREEVLEPWFVRASLTGAREISDVIDEYNEADPSGRWLQALLEHEHDIPIEVLASVSGAMQPDHVAVAWLPWSTYGGEEWAERAYAARLLELASVLVPRESWPVLARLGADWQGSLGDLVRCVAEVT
jgi:hypothetical protein